MYQCITLFLCCCEEILATGLLKKGSELANYSASCKGSIALQLPLQERKASGNLLSWWKVKGSRCVTWWQQEQERKRGGATCFSATRFYVNSEWEFTNHHGDDAKPFLRDLPPWSKHLLLNHTSSIGGYSTWDLSRDRYPNYINKHVIISSSQLLLTSGEPS